MNIYFLERACQAQIKAQAGGRLNFPAADVCERTAARFNREESAAYADMVWTSALRLIA